ncbi:MAG: hypothetical protein JXA52_05390 [Planctomycetes bacterium]|nr:hypothetical protein [Planctomycetota bacterium]
MKNKPAEISPGQETDKLKEIPKWSRRYALYRCFPAIVGFILLGLLFAGIAIPARFAGKASAEGNPVQYWILMTVMIISMLLLIFFVLTPWGRKITKRIGNSFYAQEGCAGITDPETIKKRERKGMLTGMMIGACVGATMPFVMSFNLSEKYLQPIAAGYCLPIILIGWFFQKDKVNPLGVLWVALFGLHAVLILTGAPIVFTGDWVALNMLIPMFGYGAISLIIAHFYSRYALKKLKASASMQENSNEE